MDYRTGRRQRRHYRWVLALTPVIGRLFTDVLATVVAEVRAQANSDVQRMSSIILRQVRVSNRYPIDERKGVYDLLQPTNTNINLVVRKILYPV
jgi:hypothetical protein